MEPTVLISSPLQILKNLLDKVDIAHVTPGGFSDPVTSTFPGQTVFHHIMKRKSDSEALDLLKTIGSLHQDEEIKNVLGKRDSCGQTAAFYAAASGNIECLKFINSLNHKCIPQRDHDGQNCLFYAAAKGQTAVCSFLVGVKCLPNIVDIKGSTALNFAACNGHDQTCRILLQLGADPSIVDSLGKTAIDWARTNSLKNELKRKVSTPGDRSYYRLYRLVETAYLPLRVSDYDNSVLSFCCGIYAPDDVTPELNKGPPRKMQNKQKLHSVMRERGEFDEVSVLDSVKSFRPVKLVLDIDSADSTPRFTLSKRSGPDPDDRTLFKYCGPGLSDHPQLVGLIEKHDPLFEGPYEPRAMAPKVAQPHYVFGAQVEACDDSLEVLNQLQNKPYTMTPDEAKWRLGAISALDEILRVPNAMLMTLPQHYTGLGQLQEAKICHYYQHCTLKFNGNCVCATRHFFILQIYERLVALSPYSKDDLIRDLRLLFREWGDGSLPEAVRARCSAARVILDQKLAYRASYIMVHM